METEQPSLQVAVCEDDDDLRAILVSGLPHFGLRTFGVASAESLDSLLANRPVDLVILDVGLPGEDGFSAAGRLRIERPGLGIVMLTARGQVEDRVRGLQQGADVYYVKPVDLRELAAALFSLHRRLARPQRSQRPWRLTHGHGTLETPGGATVQLTLREGRLLARLMEPPDTVVAREELCRTLGLAQGEGAPHRLEMIISRLRSKVTRLDPEATLPLKAWHRAGYAFLMDVGPTP